MANEDCAVQLFDTLNPKSVLYKKRPFRNTIPISIVDYYTMDIDTYSDDDQEDTPAVSRRITAASEIEKQPRTSTATTDKMEKQLKRTIMIERITTAAAEKTEAENPVALARLVRKTKKEQRRRAMMTCLST